MKSLSVLLMTFGLSGCIWNIDKPPPPWWTLFSGHGASEYEIRVALLECGSTVPGDPIEYVSPDGQRIPSGGLNEIILEEKCMQNAGFPFGGDDSCKLWKDIPACQPGAVIPKRSVENRLTSPYCKLYPKSRFCQSVYDPTSEPQKIKPNLPVKIPYYSPVYQVTSQVQKDSNEQMNQLLKQR